MPLSLLDYLRAQAYNNAFCNHRLISAVAGLSPADFAAKRTSFFPSIKATLNHNLTVDWYYVDALERSVHGRPVNTSARDYFEPEEPCETAAQLAAEQRAVDLRLVRLTRELTERDLEWPVGVQRRVGVLHEPLPRLLGHLFQHQIHHRGQAHAMLAGTDVAPPQLDEFFCANEAHLRASELAELGFTEVEIWGG